jgi:hypothetical protein
MKKRELDSRGAATTENEGNTETDVSALTAPWVHASSQTKLFQPSAEHTIRSMPPGQAGRLEFYKSGKVKLRFGEVLLDLSCATSLGFHQELVSVHPEEKECFRMGSVDKRMVASLDVHSLDS